MKNNIKEGIKNKKMKKQIKKILYDIKEHLKKRNYIFEYKLKICFPIFIFLLILDIITKQLAFHLLQHDFFAPEIKFFDWFINFKFMINKGVAFGKNSEYFILVIICATLITFIIFIFFLYVNNKKINIGLIMIITGGVGNLIDRIWNNGAVVDFLSWILFPPYSVFNLADTWIIIGVIVLIISIVIENIKFYFKKNKNKYKEFKNLND